MSEARFRALYADTFADVWRFARRRVESSAEADDVTAETFAVAWRRLADAPTTDARLWLFGIARNVLANHHRTERRRNRLTLRLGAVSTAAAAEPLETDPTVWHALAALSESDRELLLLRAWDELSVSDIATLLDTTAARVSSRLHKARLRLAQELQRLDPDDVPRRDVGGSGQVPADPRGNRRTAR
ncbi:RNA polymerase sigma factor [Cryptosporangium aurantiacum]|uniref:RNA polymerase sigma-70 factor, ECF subfamily n=1 Tax=Cryptosporangium aurantiacum TaxID=134849 RepID=A0A1M7RCX3_9ACTN|nr:sigma-70 family RNA polymerase sigma factor [Cryptosporangium aurantiacum]SHN44066.1 RNA polymerase sigma-70 factor, ECF subfamily [Cryptosporangium aurantiacum]